MYLSRNRELRSPKYLCGRLSMLWGTGILSPGGLTRESRLISHISQKTSEIWGTHSGGWVGVLRHGLFHGKIGSSVASSTAGQYARRARAKRTNSVASSKDFTSANGNRRVEGMKTPGLP